MKPKSIFRAGLVLTLAGFLANSSFILLDRHSYIEFLEAFAPDGHIASPNTIIIEIQAAFVVLFAWLIAAQSSLESGADLLSKSSTIDRIAYVVILIQCVMFHVWFFIPGCKAIRLLYGEDRFFEWLTVVCALLASGLLLMSSNNKEGRVVKSIRLILAVLLFGFGMEEMSWGQRVFGWKTPIVFEEFNYQSETNLHNLFNSYTRGTHAAFNLLLGCFLFNAVRLRAKILRRFKTKSYVHLIPYRGSMFYGFVFLSLFGQCVFLGGELTEQVFSVFALAYAVNQLRVTRSTTFSVARTG